ncbi:MAG: response regulator [bacterium]|nr:response regulator [bacterium]
MKDSQTGKKLLIVDDDKFLVNMYSAKFKSEGFEVETANNGQEALGKIRNGLQADGVVFDIVMPSMDGLEFLRVMKKENLLPNAASIALTNQSQPTDMEEAEKLGVKGYIVKASTIPSEVVEEVRKILKK